MNNYFFVSVIVLTYNADLYKLKETINSVLIQKKVKIQLIISDDGSADNHFKELEEWFDAEKIHDFLFVPSKVNKGTVQNIRKGLEYCKGQFVKLLSPGDMLIGDTVLYKWIMFMKKDNVKWSFSDIINYTYDEIYNKKYIRATSRPLIINDYVRGSLEKCRWNYVALGDCAIGASIITEYGLINKYINLISEKVIYAEDVIYQLMMFDGIIGGYFQENAILYEYGSGISTSNNKRWESRIDNDYKQAAFIMCERKTKDVFQRKALKKLKDNWIKDRIIRVIRFATRKRGLYYLLKKNYFPRITSSSLPSGNI